eukprot:72693_1
MPKRRRLFNLDSKDEALTRNVEEQIILETFRKLSYSTGDILNKNISPTINLEKSASSEQPTSSSSQVSSRRPVATKEDPLVKSVRDLYFDNSRLRKRVQSLEWQLSCLFQCGVRIPSKKAGGLFGILRELVQDDSFCSTLAIGIRAWKIHRSFEDVFKYMSERSEKVRKFVDLHPSLPKAMDKAVANYNKSQNSDHESPRKKRRKLFSTLEESGSTPCPAADCSKEFTRLLHTAVHIN